MSIQTTLSQVGNAPAVYITERVSGLLEETASFNATYIVVDVPIDVPVTLFPINTPIQINNLNDYLNLIGGTFPASYGGVVSYNTIAAFFNNSALNPVLFVIRTGVPASSYLVRIQDSDLTALLGNASVQYLRFQINNIPVGLEDATNGYLGLPFEVLTTDTLQVLKKKIVDNFYSFIERDNAIKDAVYIRETDIGTGQLEIDLVPRLYGSSLTISSIVTPIPAGYQSFEEFALVSQTRTVNDDFTVTDYIQTIETSFDNDLLDLGVLLAPSAFAQLDQTERLAVSQAIERVCRNKYWFGLIDQGNPDISRIKRIGGILVSGIANFTGYSNVVANTRVKALNSVWYFSSAYTAPSAPTAATAIPVGDRCLLPVEVTIGNRTSRIVEAIATNSGFAILNNPTTVELSKFKVITLEDVVSENFLSLSLEMVESAIDNHAKAYAESLQITSGKGYIGYYAPYGIDRNGFTVPISSAVAGILQRRVSIEGIPSAIPAGFSYPLTGFTNLSYNITRANQEVSNPKGLNAVREIPNKGIIVMGARTRSNEPLFRFINTRIITNVIIETLENSFDSVLFTPLDNLTSVFAKIKVGIENILYNFYTQGFFAPPIPEQAYQVICDRSINPSNSLENGIINAQVYIIPTGTLERLLIGVIRVPIDSLPTTS